MDKRIIPSHQLEISNDEYLQDRMGTEIRSWFRGVTMKINHTTFG